MKRTALLLSVLAAPLFAASSASAQDLKVGIVDMARVFGEYHKTKDAEAELEKRKQEARGELEGQDTKLKSYKEQLDALRKSVQDPAVSATVKESKKKKFEQVAEEAQALRTELLEFARRREAQLLEMFNRKRDGILAELREAVTKKSELTGYDLVFDKSARSTRDVPFLLYSKDARDFSAELIAELNASK
jgi:Skp family chaperone for outer membrane proteins